MSKCKLYLAYPDHVARVGEFKDRAKAETYYNQFRRSLEHRHGPGGKQIYVETGKGKGK